MEEDPNGRNEDNMKEEDQAESAKDWLAARAIHTTCATKHISAVCPSSDPCKSPDRPPLKVDEAQTVKRRGIQEVRAESCALCCNGNQTVCVIIQH